MSTTLEELAQELSVLLARVKAEAEKKPVVVESKPDPIEKQIMRACKSVADAEARLKQARFSGKGEALARQKLERAAAALRRVMTENRRMPKSVLFDEYGADT